MEAYQLIKCMHTEKQYNQINKLRWNKQGLMTHI